MYKFLPLLLNTVKVRLERESLTSFYIIFTVVPVNGVTKAIFSIVSVYLSIGEGSLYKSLGPFHTGPSYPPQTCSNLFNIDFTLRDPPPRGHVKIYSLSKPYCRQGGWSAFDWNVFLFTQRLNWLWGMLSVRFVVVDTRGEQAVGDCAMDVVSSRVAVPTSRRK